MQVLSVNVALPRKISFGGQEARSGINKGSVQGRVAVQRQHLVGDGQADRDNHGGLDKAVCAYPAEHYDHWRTKLGRDIAYGQFGENLTIQGLLEGDVAIGATLKVGSAVLQVTQPRKPCFKLGWQVQSAHFTKAFLESGRLGFYLRVLTEGHVAAGDAMEPQQRPVEALTVRDIWRLAYSQPWDAVDAQRALGLSSLGPEWHQPIERRLLG